MKLYIKCKDCSVFYQRNSRSRLCKNCKDKRAAKVRQAISLRWESKQKALRLKKKLTQSE